MKRLASSDPLSNQSGRQRSKIACLPCRQRKRKCDSNLPCGTCLKYDYPCKYGPTDRQNSDDEVSLGSLVVPQDPTSKTTNSRKLEDDGASSRQALTAPGARFQHRHILDPSKILFVRASGAIAFPRLLGMDLEFAKIPPLRAFGWHLGLRTNDSESTDTTVTRLLTWSEMQSLADTYFRVVNTEIGFLDREDFTDQVTKRFTTSDGSAMDLDSVMLGVAALGSFFSAEPHPSEELIISAAQNILVRLMTGPPTMTSVAGWILRTILLRLTSDAHGSYLASGIAVNMAAGCGLQKEINTVAIVYPAVSADSNKLANDRRRLFWIGRSLNIVLAFEYGRNSLTFDGITTRKPTQERGSRTHIFIAMADVLPNDHLDPNSSKDPTSALLTALSKLHEIESDSHLQNLMKADLVFAIYRRLWLMSLTDAKNRWDTVLSVGKKALDAAEALLQARLPWWNIVHCTFQFLCIILSIGNPQSLAFTNKIMELLHKIADAYNTHIVREAYNQASSLIKMSRDRKKRELEAISSYADENELSVVSTPAPSTTTDQFTFDWVTDLPINWEDLLNPNLMLSEQIISDADLLAVTH